MYASRRFWLIGAALAFATALSPARAELNIVTTTADFAAIARAIGGSAAKVDALASGASDPHFVAAKPSMIRRAKDFTEMQIDLEVWDLDHLTQIITGLKGKGPVSAVDRIFV